MSTLTKSTLLAAALALSACAQRPPLPPAPSPPASLSDADHCAIVAHQYAERPEARARAFILGVGLSLLSLPIIAAQERRDTRDAFDVCMASAARRSSG